jgi:ankyrin repeat protein
MHDRPLLPAESLALPHVYKHRHLEVSVDSAGITWFSRGVQKRLVWSELRLVRRTITGAFELSDAGRTSVLRLPKETDGLQALLNAIAAQLELSYTTRVKKPMPLRGNAAFSRSRLAWFQLLGALVVATAVQAWLGHAYYFFTGVLALVSALGYLSRLPTSIEIGPEWVATQSPLKTTRFATAAIRTIDLRLDRSAGPVVIVATSAGTSHELRAFGDRALFVYDRLRQAIPGTTTIQTAPVHTKLALKRAAQFLGTAAALVAAVLYLPILSGAALQQSARMGSTRAADVVLRLGARIEAGDHEGKTALYNAAKHGRAEVMRLLLARGANPRVRSGTEAGHTPLHVAAEYNQLDAVRVLLDAGVAADIPNNWRQTPLYQLAMLGHARPAEIAIVDLLVEAGADVNAQDRKGFAPIHVAARRANLPFLRHLIARGARLDTRTHDGAAPLDYAVYRRKWDSARVLVSGGADVNARDGEGQSLLGWAISKADVDLVRGVLDLGARMDLDDDGWTPLQHAAWNGQETIAKLLLQRGANPDASTREGPPLRIAARRGHANYARVLLDHRAACDPPFDDWSPMQVAASLGHAAVIEVLVQAGCDPHDVGERTAPAMILAAQHGHVEVVRTMLANGVSPDVTFRGWTPLRVAATSRQGAIVSLLRERGATD